MKQQILSISNFKKFTLYLLLPFIATTLILCAGVNYVFEKKIVLGSQASGAYKVNRIIHGFDKNEVAILGSSRAEGSYIPDSLVKDGFNYGMPGTQDNVILFFLEEECKKNKTTPIIINFDLDGLNYSIGDVSNYVYNAGYRPVKHLLDSNYKAVFNIPVFKYYGYFELFTKFYLNDRINLTKYTDKGASVDKNIVTRQKFQESVNERLKQQNTFRNDPRLLNQLVYIIKTHKARKFIFVVAPYHPSFFKGFTNVNEAETFLSYLRSFDNSVVLNFSRMQCSDDDFTNTTHLNLKGAIEFDRTLRDSLKHYIQ